MRPTLLIFFLFYRHASSEPITIGVTFLAGALASYFYGSSISDVAKSAACKTGVAYYGDKYIECCEKPWVKADVVGNYAMLFLSVNFCG